MKTCQWVEGDPGIGEWRYCGAPATDPRGRPWCAAHLARVYVSLAVYQKRLATRAGKPRPRPNFNIRQPR